MHRDTFLQVLAEGWEETPKLKSAFWKMAIIRGMQFVYKHGVLPEQWVRFCHLPALCALSLSLSLSLFLSLSLSLSLSFSEYVFCSVRLCVFIHLFVSDA
jgi:hypothetical protein